MPELVEFHRDDRPPGVRVLAVSLDPVTEGGVSTSADIALFASAKGFDLPLAGYNGALEDLALRYALDGGLPTTLVIDRSGEVVARHDGPLGRQGFVELVEAALAAPGARPPR